MHCGIRFSWCSTTYYKDYVISVFPEIVKQKENVILTMLSFFQLLVSSGSNLLQFFSGPSNTHEFRLFDHCWCFWGFFFPSDTETEKCTFRKEWKQRGHFCKKINSIGIGVIFLHWFGLKHCYRIKWTNSKSLILPVYVPFPNTVFWDTKLTWGPEIADWSLLGYLK